MHCKSIARKNTKKIDKILYIYIYRIYIYRHVNINEARKVLNTQICTVYKHRRAVRFLFGGAWLKIFFRIKLQYNVRVLLKLLK